MTERGFYGENAKQFCRLEQQPSSLITRSLRNTEIAVTETRDDAPARSLSGAMPLEDSFVVSLKLNDYPSCELWAHGKCVTKADIRAGATYLYDMKTDLRFVINKPFHSLHFYLPRSALDGIAEQFRAPRVGQLPCQLGVGHDDAVVRHIGGALLPALRRPTETSRLFIDYTMLALTAHVAQTYGRMRVTKSVHGGLAPWQLKRACERLDADLGGELSLQQIAAEFDLSVSYFSRAFRSSAGLPPHQWLLRQRVKAAKQLMTVRELPLAEIAISAGFANQSHFTRVFTATVGISPGVWRREKLGLSEGMRDSG
ncbi:MULTISPECIES: AraC family transcriptional regulator [unclassified Bradyrhizobium]|uniref:helix-turn-helix domain-containing protein n=1 Tax=unclassified Bradyrhizobium TaxID=2631580 RepID=UPI001BAD3217|nr:MULTISPECIES: AraC family transcriptional regulator [unclassified Bradyrhizobium]MBR1206069.1 helix-turn-helix transcriptional regulator [Bradyrhizobium sp. AUGA SZCCT0124]MBR1314805.1 helix-turn-helix transcriptional regulator [Bradyrhizobium sp. AUGA SZCCT0051]MBR1341776.1 helix-turn-helix transcriptional regulator [Bradyrhizobium sp. AUGA SZCCT0105]MBR1358823.1 helix-turn-helix transcriptional regulator [Bradyrhizobium sp. AUGA SZCCT0045]